MEVFGDPAEGLSGVDAHFGVAEHRGDDSVMVEVRGDGFEVLGVQEFDGVSVLRRGLDEFVKDVGLELGLGHVERAAGVGPETRFADDGLPDRLAFKGEAKVGSGGLADGPDHTEIADGGSLGGGRPFDDDDLEAPFCRSQRVSEAENPGTDNGDVVSHGRYETDCDVNMWLTWDGLVFFRL